MKLISNIPEITDALQNSLPNADTTINITFAPHVNSKRQNVLWHGGEVARFEYNGNTYTIEALGDVIAELYNKKSGTRISRIKDKRGGGDFGSMLEHYIDSDSNLFKMLDDLHPDYAIEFEDNNELSIVKNNDEFFTPNADQLGEVIVEYLNELFYKK
jgi:hypothetical protein